MKNKRGGHRIFQSYKYGWEGSLSDAHDSKQTIKSKLALLLYGVLNDQSFKTSKSRLAILNMKDSPVFRTYQDNQDNLPADMGNALWFLTKKEAGHTLHGARDMVKDILDKQSLPSQWEGKRIEGLVELVAIAKLLGDIDVFGDNGACISLNEELDRNNVPVLRIVKQDTKQVFVYDTQKNVRLEEKNIQVSPKNDIPFMKLTDSDRRLFIKALKSAIFWLRQEGFLTQLLTENIYFKIDKTKPSLDKLVQDTLKEVVQDIKANIVKIEKLYEISFHSYGEDQDKEGLYEGEHNQGKQRDGKGTLWASDGSLYQGNWSNHRAYGFGVKLYPDSSIYEVQWKEGKRSGDGVFYTLEGDRYEGLWRDDQMEVQGLKKWKNGDRYMGDWSKGKRHGQGVYFYANGSVFSGKFDKHQPTEGHLFSDKQQKEGRFVNNKFEVKK